MTERRVSMVSKARKGQLKKAKISTAVDVDRRIWRMNNCSNIRDSRKIKACTRMHVDCTRTLKHLVNLSEEDEVKYT